MALTVKNLHLSEVGKGYVAEADFRDYHISLRCSYNPRTRYWEAEASIHELEDVRLRIDPPPALRALSLSEVICLGMQFAVTHLTLEEAARNTNSSTSRVC